MIRAVCSRFILASLIAALIIGCGSPKKEQLSVEKIPFDPKNSCTVEFSIPVDSFHEDYLDYSCIVLPDGNYLLAGGINSPYRKRISEKDTTTEISYQLDCYLEKISSKGEVLWRKTHALNPAGQDFIQTIRACSKGGFIASVNKVDEEDDGYGGRRSVF